MPPRLALHSTPKASFTDTNKMGLAPFTAMTLIQDLRGELDPSWEVVRMFYPESSSLTVTGFNLAGQIYACKGQRNKEKFPFAIEA